LRRGKPLRQVGFEPSQIATSAPKRDVPVGSREILPGTAYAEPKEHLARRIHDSVRGRSPSEMVNPQQIRIPTAQVTESSRVPSLRIAAKE
jgi:hypothetical protein